MITLSPRLSLASSLVRRDSRFADIGTDHGYVPAFLLENGLISYAIACDINEGPLSSCRELVEELKLTNIDCRISNGLQNIREDEVDDILLAGMGGELIVKILSECDYVSKKHIIINAMTHPELVRKWLFDNKFEINNDLLIKDSDRIYSVLDATYTGMLVPKMRKDYYLGNIKDFKEKEFFMHLKNYLTNKQKSGVDYSDVINAIEEIL